ncbi:MAG: DUF4129 domain-containing protein [Thermoflexales bacterium]
MTPDQEQETLRQILARMATPTPAPFTRASGPEIPPPDFELLAQLAQFILYAALGIAILVVAAAAIGALARRARRSQPAPVSSPARPEIQIEEATRHAEAGDMRTAMRHLYLAALAVLDERGVLRFDPALTNREIARAVRPRPELEGALMPVIDIYDPVWYGHKTISTEQFEGFKLDIQNTLRLSESALVAAQELPA